MRVLVDTNVLARSLQPGHPQQQVADDAVAALVANGDAPCVVPQVLYELWVVCTRPQSANGFGISAPNTAAVLSTIKSMFLLLADSAAIFPEWEQLVTTAAVIGKNAHDARLVAAMTVHGVSHLLTFNDQDFRRFTRITILTPQSVIAGSPKSTPT